MNKPGQTWKLQNGICSIRIDQYISLIRPAVFNPDIVFSDVADGNHRCNTGLTPKWIFTSYFTHIGIAKIIDSISHCFDIYTGAG
jgi:hypothetical protein